MTLPVARIAVHMPALPDRVAPSFLRLVVEDTSFSDAPATVVTSLSVEVRGGLHLDRPQTLVYDLPYVGDGRDLSAAVVVTSSPAGRVRPGDLVTAAAVPLRPPGEVTEVPLVPVP